MPPSTVSAVPLRLTGSVATATGVVIATYERARGQT